MNIYSFFNSKDVAKHLKTIDYQFSSLECAYIIWQCKHTSVEEKHTAYKELIESMPDCKIEATEFSDSHESLHKFLEAYMIAEQKLINRFYEDETGSVYTYDWYLEGTNDWLRDNLFRGYDFYSTYAKCEASIKEYLTEEAVLLHVSKKWLDNEFSEIVAHITPNGSLIQISESFMYDDEKETLENVFRCLAFDIPVPFKRGDILQLNTGLFPCNHYAKYFVLDVCKAAPNTEDDETNMLAYCYCTDENGKLINNHVSTYLNCEYLSSELPKDERVLKILSDLIKQTSDEAELLNAYWEAMTE